MPAVVVSQPGLPSRLAAIKLRTLSLATFESVPETPALALSQSAASCAWSLVKDEPFSVALIAFSTAVLASSLAHAMLLNVVVPSDVATVALKIWMPL